MLCKNSWIALLCSYTLFAFPLNASTEIIRGTPPTEKEPRAELEAAFEAANLVMKNGPTEVILADQATLKLPEGVGFVPKLQARRVMEAMGNQPGDTLLGLILPISTDQDSWLMIVSYINAGYVRDDDAKHWDAEDLLEDLKAGADNANLQRREHQIPEMDITGWVEKPQYDAQLHHLVWSVASRQRGEIDSQYADVNYNTLLLGRQGFISINLVTDLSEVESLKPLARTVLAGLEFNEGKRYSDFNDNTDKIAEFGLAVLVAGVAAQKLGLIATLIGLVIKLLKLVGLGVVILASIAGGKAWKRKKNKKKAAVTLKNNVE
ncbi:MAG: DUF2167 domain-containing protein [Gammaproteobacteria bacterium]|nr:DUF2167 domain-containing protein [Gammaproteobacteria bacterium]